MDIKSLKSKHCENIDKDEDNSPKTLNDKTHQASSQKFKQQIFLYKMFNESLLLLFIQEYILAKVVK